MSRLPVAILAAAAALIGLATSAGAQIAAPQAPTLPPQTASPGATLMCGERCVRAATERAIQPCAKRIEAEAPGDYEWINRPYGSIFQEADAPERPDSAVIRYRGDSVRFMSPQKEWLRVVYECGFDAATQQVAFLQVRLGVLGKASAVPAAPLTPQASRAPSPTPAARKPSASAPVQPSPTVSASAPVNLRRMSEPSEVDVRQVPVRARPQF